MAASILVRPSADADISEIAGIYGHHVLHGLASFEEVAPAAEEAPKAADGAAEPEVVGQKGKKDAEGGESKDAKKK